MKKNYLFGLLALVMGMFVFFSCSSDDDDDIDTSSLVGKWINTKIDWNESGELDSQTYNDVNRYIVLRRDGTGEVSPYNLFEDEKRDAFKWHVSENKLVIKESDGDVEEYIVVKITDTELVLRWEDRDDDSYFIETHTFRKQVDTDD